MRILLADGGALLESGRIMSKRHIVQREQKGGAVWEVRNDHGVGHTAVLVQNDKVGHIVGSGRVGEFLHDRVTTIDAGCIGEHQPHFLFPFDSSQSHLSWI